MGAIFDKNGYLCVEIQNFRQKGLFVLEKIKFFLKNSIFGQK